MSCKSQNLCRGKTFKLIILFTESKFEFIFKGFLCFSEALVMQIGKTGAPIYIPASPPHGGV